MLHKIAFLANGFSFEHSNWPVMTLKPGQVPSMGSDIGKVDIEMEHLRQEVRKGS